MAFQADKIPGLESSNGSSDDAPLLFSGPRGVAVRILSRAESSDNRVEKLIDRELRMSEWAPYDRALLIELVYGTLRWQARLDWVLTGFYHGEFTKCLVPVKNAMRVALYQILMLSKIPPSTAVNECASTIRRIKDDKSANIIAGVLKNILRNVEGIRYPSKDDNIQLFYAVTLSHPLWMVKRWCERFGDEEAERILSSHNERPSIYLYAHPQKGSAEDLHQWLKDHDCTSETLPGLDSVLRVNGLQNVWSMEALQDGRASVCSPSDVHLAHLIDLKAQESALYLGNAEKSLIPVMLIEGSAEAPLTLPCPFDATRKAVEDDCKRLGIKNLRTELIVPSMTHEAAHVVVVDAPCSGLGCIHTRPELRWKIELDAVRKACAAQKASLDSAAPLVKSGGRLIYVVQSAESEETVDIVRWFLESHPEFSLDANHGRCPEEVMHDGMLQCAMHSNKLDTMFAARFVRQ